MTKRSKKTAATALLQDVLGEHYEAVLAAMPEEQREAMVDAIGAGTLRQDESSRLADEAVAKSKAADERQAAADAKLEETKAWHGQINTWWVTEQENIKKSRDEVARMRAASGGDNDNDDDDTDRKTTPAAPVTVPEGYVKKEEMDQALVNVQAGIARQGVTLVGALQDQQEAHRAEFGEPLNMRELIAHCEKVNRPIDQGGYDSFVAELRKTKGETDKEKLVEDAEKRGEERAYERLKSENLPYPVGGAPAFGGSLRNLGIEKGKRENVGVDAAVRGLMENRRKTGVAPST